MGDVQQYKLAKSNLSDKVFCSLKSMVLSGKWEIGEKIPSEQVLSTMFGVSRLTVRIAIERLNALHILETRVGEGTYVQPFNFQDFISEIDDLMLSDRLIINDVRSYRTAIELCAIEDLLKRPEEEYSDDIRKLELLCDRMDELYIPLPADISSEKSEDIISEYVQLDYSFHCKLCKHSGNKLVYYSYLMAKSPIIQYLLLLTTKRSQEFIRDHPEAKRMYFEKIYEPALLHSLHRSILNAIHERDFPLCQLIHRHMHNYVLDSSDFKNAQQNNK